MKSHVFQMKYFLAGIYIICVIFTCFNARFYHTPLAKISSVTEKETMSRKGTRDAEEYYYTQKITARILNGTHKGEEISISNEYTSSQVQNQDVYKRQLSTYHGKLQAGTYLLSTAYTPNRIMGILAGDDEQEGVSDS